MNISRFFIDRPVFAGVRVDAHLRLRPARPRRPADLGISRGRAAAGRGPRQLPGRQPQGDRRNGRHPDRGADHRRRRHALHGKPGDHGRADDADRHLQARRRPGQGAAARAEPRRPGRAAPAGGGARPGHHHAQGLAGPDDGRASRLARWPLRRDLSAQLRRAEREGPDGRHRRRGRRAAFRLRRLRHAHLAGPGEDGRARPFGQRRRRPDPRAERAGRRRRHRLVPEHAGSGRAALGQCAGPAAIARGVRRHRRQNRR